MSGRNARVDPKDERGIEDPIAQGGDCLPRPEEAKVPVDKQTTAGNHYARVTS